MCCELSIFRMLSIGELQRYSRAHKKNTNPESNRLEVISINDCYKDLHLYDKFLLPSVYSRVRPNRNEYTS